MPLDEPDDYRNRNKRQCGRTERGQYHHDRISRRSLSQLLAENVCDLRGDLSEQLLLLQLSCLLRLLNLLSQLLGLPLSLLLLSAGSALLDGGRHPNVYPFGLDSSVISSNTPACAAATARDAVRVAEAICAAPCPAGLAAIAES